jgi:3-deoxy-D-manno-octulosonic-acid transferase
MLFLYNLGIQLYYILIILYQNFNTKAQLWVRGRKNIFEKISKEVNPHTPSIWFHFASLGEFEQGRPVLERAKESYPTHKIIVTFFSPSGYELRKNFNKADHIYYLPIDTNRNAERFVELINPTLAIFTKYEFWYHYFNQLSKRNIPLIVISAIFRESQPFFKWHGKFGRKTLGLVSHFFVQDENSKRLLAQIHLTNVTVSGDTRFDRVVENSEQPKDFLEVKTFCKNSQVFVAGSTWPEDEKIILPLLSLYPDWKFIIAPHEIKEEKIEAIRSGNNSALRYSDLKADQSLLDKNPQLLIIDNIGMLSSLYQYADVSYIGGGFGVGIHNTLEAAAFGVPVIFGPNYHNFREAKALIASGAAFTISNQNELNSIMHKLAYKTARELAGHKGRDYVQQEKGATQLIISYLHKIIK